MSEETASISADESSAASARVPDGRLHAALESVIAVSNDVSDSSQAAQAVVDRLVGDLELSRARLYLLTSEGDSPCHAHLELSAAAGPHAAFTREMPSVALDRSSDIARVGQSGEPEFHGDVHGFGQEPEGGHKGLGRWRAGVTTQSSAVLSLAIRGRLIGVLSMEWSAPREFDGPEREDLVALAGAATLVIDSFLAEERVSNASAQPVAEEGESTCKLEIVEPGPEIEAETPESGDQEPRRAALAGVSHSAPQSPAGAVRESPSTPINELAVCEPADVEPPIATADLEVTAEAVVVPAGIPGGWVSAPALTLRAAATRADSTQQVFWDATGLPNGFVALSLGIATSPQGHAAEVAETAQHLLRASALQGEGPARGLGLLGGWLASAGSGTAWVSAIVIEIDVKQATASWCAAGSTALVSRYADGRLSVSASRYSPLGSSAILDAAEHDIMLLPGDRIALACGDIDALSAAPNRSDMKVSLAAGIETDVLMRSLGASGSGAGAFVVEVMSL